ncbi:MAG TPA: hypothetical protein VGB56_14970 [Flavisolibacter sp.]|jgi:hypothetical protein
MKTILSILFYFTMAGTTATVGTVLGEEKTAGESTPVEIVKKRELKAEIAPRTPAPSKALKLKALAARHTAAGVVVTWAAAPGAVSSFLVEQSANGQAFTTVATIPASEAVAYKYCVVANAHQSGFYRIGAINTDGQIDYSAAKKVRSPR